MKKFLSVCCSAVSLLALSGCASTPMGPTVQALPGQGKAFEIFQQDQILCKQYADDQTRGQAENANERAIGAGLLTTALGAGLGAAIDGGSGAAIGAAAGGLGGAAIGAGTSSQTQVSIQKQYNNAYTQCMYAKGNQIQQVYVPPAVVYQPAAPQVVYQPAPPPVVYQPAPQVIYQGQPQRY